MTEIKDRLNYLEEKIAFQEQTIDELNEALTNQQQNIDKMHIQIKYIIDKLKGSTTSNIADAEEETPPPHY